MEKEEKRRALELKLALKMEQLKWKDVEKEIRLRRVQLREKEAMTQMHQFYPLLAEARRSGKYTKLLRTVENLRQHSSSEPNLRPKSAPNFRQPPSPASRGGGGGDSMSVVSKASRGD